MWAAVTQFRSIDRPKCSEGKVRTASLAAEEGQSSYSHYFDHQKLQNKTQRIPQCEAPQLKVGL